jgi:hypothetical protein
MRMDNFYTNVHDLNYYNFNCTLNRYRNRIIVELKKFGKNENFFAGKVVLDIGTGFQGVIALEMGAKSVIHVDINQNQLDLMGRELVRLGLSEKVTQLNIDLNKDNLLGLEKYDVGLIFGIINHLNNPSLSIGNLQSRLNFGGELLLRAYNGKSITRILIEKIRYIANGTDYDSVNSSYCKKYGDLAKNSFHLRDLLDDLYSPIVKNFIIPSNYLIKNNDSFMSRDENLRFNLKKEDKVLIEEKNICFLMAPIFLKINSKNRVPLIIDLYEIVRSLKFINNENGSISYFKSKYQNNDLLKIITFHLTIFKFLFRKIYEGQVRIFR